MPTPTNSNKGWYTARSRKVTMEEWGRPDLYVAFRDIQSLPYGESMEISKKFQGFDAEKMDDKAVAAMFDQVIDLILEWHMENPTKGGEMPKPKSSADLGDIPLDVLMHLVSGALDSDEDGTVPKETTTKPTALQEV